MKCYLKWDLVKYGILKADINVEQKFQTVSRASLGELKEEEEM